MTREQWLAASASATHTEVPTTDDIDAMLELAGVAAHTSDRTAAPITCWMAAAAGLPPSRALALARSIQEGN
jgi:Domain of unknown function (DUF6457)